jgi:DNA modification methylase
VLVVQGDARELPLPDASVDLIVTSPPYFGLRSYTDGGEHYIGQIGSEATPAAYVAALVACTAEWVRVLKQSGSLFVNLGDKYAGSGGDGNSGLAHSYAGDVKHIPRSGKRWTHPAKSLLGLPWRYALTVTDQLGLILRAEIIWAKPNGLPESVTDRVRRAHEQVFHFTVRPRYYSAVDEIREPHNPATHARGRNGAMERDGVSLPTWGASGTQSLRGVEKRYLQDPLGKLPGSVWSIPSQPLTVPPALGVDHFAAFPMELPRRLILGWSPPGVCVGCGQGRRPVTERQAMVVRPSTRRLLAQANGNASRTATGGTVVTPPSATITGYACRCATPAAPVNPAVVLDPFGGTGTTALLAHTLGRTGITIDRSADYARIAAWRTTDPGERARAMQVDRPPPVHPDQDTLFEVTS